MKNKSVIYVNYCPYENSGHILDYLLENFERVYLFSIAFHPLGSKRHLNKFSVYQNGKIVSEDYLFYLQIPQSLVLILIPIRSIMNACQILWKSLSIVKQHGKVDVFFSVNAFTSSLGMLLKKIDIVRTNIFWVWDYYPLNHPNLVPQIMRWMYWQFDKLATYSDRVIYLNDRLAQVRKDAGLIRKNTKYLLVPIAMGQFLPVKRKNLNQIKIGFIGVLKKSQGLDMLFDSAQVIARSFKNLAFEIIGSGPDENYFRHRAKRSPVRFHFYGLVSDAKFKRVLYDCTLGVAPYTPEDSNVSRYGDPGKVKRYMEFNLPAIITDVFEFSQELKSRRAGLVIRYNDAAGLARAIKRITDKYSYYVENVIKLHQSFYYRSVYPEMFNLDETNL